MVIEVLVLICVLRGPAARRGPPVLAITLLLPDEAPQDPGVTATTTTTPCGGHSHHNVCSSQNPAPLPPHRLFLELLLKELREWGEGPTIL